MQVDGGQLLNVLAAVLAGKPPPLGAQPRILLAAQPKSASTWVSQQLSAMSGLPQLPLVPGYGGREQELSELRLSLFAGQGFVACHHLRWSVPTGTLIDQFGLQPVILVRNLYDVVVSTSDHLDREGIGAGTPMMWLEPDFLRLPPSERMDALIDLVVPWHLQFYLSWLKSGRTDLIWLTYEDLFSGDPKELLGSLCEALGIEPIPQPTESKPSAGSRFNVGTSGRGLQRLSDSQITRIQSLAAHYGPQDFSMIGL